MILSMRARPLVQSPPDVGFIAALIAVPSVKPVHRERGREGGREGGGKGEEEKERGGREG